MHLDADLFTEYQLNLACTGRYAAVDIFLFMILGVIGGILGSFFNAVSSRLHHFRIKHVSKSGWRRLGEAIVIVAMTCSLVVFAPNRQAYCSNVEQLYTHVPDKNWSNPGLVPVIRGVGSPPSNVLPKKKPSNNTCSLGRTWRNGMSH